MSENVKNRRRKFISQLKHTHRLVFFNDNTFEEVWHLRITMMNVLSIVGFIILILVVGSMSLVMFTPLRYLVPGYPSEDVRTKIVTNAMRLDSLEHEIRLRDRYFNAINAIVAGREPEIEVDSEDNAVDGNDNPIVYDNIVFTRSVQDSLLRRRVEEEERFNIANRTNILASSFSDEMMISRMLFFKPVEGVISNRFNMNENHFGVDIVATPNQVVKSILDGTVILSMWTSETGYVIQVQHTANIISIYKHNARLLKRKGERVRVGEPIAIIGNSGEITTGPHLHFEIWQNGIPVNPEDFIVF